MASNIAVLILAAGEGTRMKSDVPKVLHTIAGRPMIEWVLCAAKRAGASSIGVVVGHGADAVRKKLSADGFGKARFFLQAKPRGSGDAVRCAKTFLRGRRDVVVLCGDAPLVSSNSIREIVRLRRSYRGCAAVVLSMRPEGPAGYGRIVHESGFGEHAGPVAKIVEEKDIADADERRITEVNTGAYCFSCPDLLRALSRLKTNNAKGEYYLTDVVEMLAGGDSCVHAYCTLDAGEGLGINSRVDLANVGKIAGRRILEGWMNSGVTIADPCSTHVDASVVIGRDTVIMPGTFLRGATRIGRHCSIGPHAYLENTTVDDRAQIRASFIYSGTIGREAQVGPFAHIRGPAVVGPRARVGNFTEVKKSRIGENTKVSHLSYIGDAVLGRHINIGAGTITCNFDGIKKNPSWIGDNTFVGSNVNLIAPVRIGRNAVIGAGSTIDKNVPSGALAIARSRQMNKKGYKKCTR